MPSFFLPLAALLTGRRPRPPLPSGRRGGAAPVLAFFASFPSFFGAAGGAIILMGRCRRLIPSKGLGPGHGQPRPKLKKGRARANDRPEQGQPHWVGTGRWNKP